MILKTFQLKNSLLENHFFFLFYGNNEGHKKNIFDNLLKNWNVLK